MHSKQKNSHPVVGWLFFCCSLCGQSVQLGGQLLQRGDLLLNQAVQQLGLAGLRCLEGGDLFGVIRPFSSGFVLHGMDHVE